MEHIKATPTKLLKLTAILSLLSLALMTTACSDKPDDSDDQAQQEQSEDKDAKAKADPDKEGEDDETAVPVEVTNVIRGDIQQTYRSITTLEAEQDADVVARSTGLLESILVEEGDQVAKGQLLAQLDVDQLSLEVDQLQATAKKLSKELERQQALYSRQLGSSDALDRAKFEYQSQLAQLKLSKLKLEYASIKAPIAGTITERHVKPGNLIRENDLLFKVVDTSSLKAILHLPEKELFKVSKGQKVLLSVDAFPDQLVAGEVERIRPAIDTSTGTFRVVAQLDNSQNYLKPGMFGKVEVVFDVHQDSLLLQQQALITQDNRSHVFVVQENKAIQTPVKIGFRNNGLVEITDGLAESDQVITTGQQLLKHEALVEIVPDEEQLAEKAISQSPAGIAINP